MDLQPPHFFCMLMFFMCVAGPKFKNSKALVSAAKVQEKHLSACNAPCGGLQLTCPAAHSIAVREAQFRVQKRAASCTKTQICDGQTSCCEQAQGLPCVFDYSLSHLEALHRNCSGRLSCAVKTERTQEESVRCAFDRPQTTDSRTVIDYFCISDSIIIDMCTPGETTLGGRKLFARLDWRMPRREPLEGAVCRCTAESARWPTTNTIAVFVVDVRLNGPGQTQCSDTVIALRSGQVSKRLNCAAARNPRLTYPFGALLNHSNVAILETFVGDLPPEYVWIGFESNEQEDIRLTCGLQGYVPISRDVEDEEINSTTSMAEENEKNVGAVAGGVAGGVILCFVLLVAVLPFVVRRCRRARQGQYTDPNDPLNVFADVYYTTPDMTSRAQNPAAVMQNRDDKVPPKSETDPEYYSIGTEGADCEIYINPADVREKKRQIGKKRVRIVSTPDIADNGGDDNYASPLDIRDRRRQQDGDNDAVPPKLPPKLDRRTSRAVGADAEEGYATLERSRTGSAQETAEIDVSYDHLGLSPRVNRPPGDDKLRAQYTNVGDPKDSHGEAIAVRCKQNAAYEDDDPFE